MASSLALQNEGVDRYVLNLGDYIDRQESRYITGDDRWIYYGWYKNLASVASQALQDVSYKNSK